MAQSDSTGNIDQAGSSRGGRSTRQRLLAVLEEGHGYPATSAEFIAAEGQRLRDHALRERVECAILVNDRTGAQLGGEHGLVRGNVEEVVLDPILVRREAGQRYVCVHTHPHNMPLSLTDAAVLATEAGARVITAVIAVTRDGTWYILSVDPATPPPTVETLRDAYGKAALATLPNHFVPAGSPPAVFAQARRGHMHNIWTHVAPAVGLRYDRVTPAPRARSAGRARRQRA